MRKRAKVVTKADIVKKVSKNTGISRKDVLDVVNSFLEELKMVIISKKTVELRGFGTFGVKVRKGRVARNPRTGEKVVVKDRYTAYFKPGRSIKVALREQERGDE